MEDYPKSLAQALWNRTLPVIDLDNGGKRIEPPTEEEWVAWTLKDLHSVEQRARLDERERTLQNVGFLRQYLNERTRTDPVTNGEILEMLELSQKDSSEWVEEQCRHGDRVGCIVCDEEEGMEL